MGKLNLLFGKKKRSSNDNESPVTPIPSTLTKNGTPRLSLEYSKSEFIIPVPKAISPPPSVQAQKEQKNDALLDEILSELSLVGTKFVLLHDLQEPKKLMQKSKRQLKDSSEDSTSEASDSNIKGNVIRRVIPNNVNEGIPVIQHKNEITQKIVTVEDWVQDVNPCDGVNNVLDRMKDRHRMEARAPHLSPPQLQQQLYNYPDDDRYDRNGRYEREPLDRIHDDYRERDDYRQPRDDYRHPRDDYRYPRDDPRYPRDDPRYPRDDPRYPRDDPRNPRDDPRYPRDDPRYPRDDPRYPKDYPRDDYRHPRDEYRYVHDDSDYHYHGSRQVGTGGRNDNLYPIENKISREKLRNNNTATVRFRNKTPSVASDDHSPNIKRYYDKSSQQIPSSSHKSPNPNVKIRPSVNVSPPSIDDSRSRRSSMSSRSDVREMVYDRSRMFKSNKYRSRNESDERLSRNDSIRSKRSHTSSISSKSSSLSERVNNDIIRREPINRHLAISNNLANRASILSIDSDIVPLGRKYGLNGLNLPNAINEDASDSQSISSNRESVASSSTSFKISNSRRKNIPSSRRYDLRPGPIPRHNNGHNGYREREDPTGRYFHDELPPPPPRYNTYQYRDDRYPPKQLPYDMPRSKYGYPPPPQPTPPSDPALNPNKKVPLIEMAGYRYDQTKRTANQPFMAKDSHPRPFSPEGSHRGGYFPRDRGYLSQEREYLQSQERDEYNPSDRVYSSRFYDRGDRREYDRERDGYGVDRYDRYNDRYNERYNDRYSDRHSDRLNDRY
ncbi:6149_t:CDS:2 [Dentiscutata erythropus]|uniref:6149_t:CDS:1 n=1 Tax=Dentiscutata erythropus TaxID=1348616 RepID=A0A9N9EBG0_9GLOM|nr:6149_t:CDS:2 [Dentiscutata erythropus]